MTLDELLQGGAQPLQGTTPSLQGGVNPQQPVNPQNPQPTVPSVTVPSQYVAPQPTPAPQPQPTPQAAPDTSLNSIFQPYIGSRPSPSSPGVLEYFNKQTGQGFSTPQELFNFASGLGAGQVSSFDQLHANVNQPQPAQAQTVGLNYPTSPVSTDPLQRLAQTAGTAGLSIDDLTKIAQANSALNPDEIAQIRQSLGIDQLAQTAFAQPTQSTVDLFNQAYSQAGLGDLKTKIQALSDQITQEQNNYADAVASVNENPFLTEASRVGRQATLATQAQQKIGNIQQEQQNLTDLYQQGLTEANAFVTRYTNDFNTTKQLAAAKLDYLNQQAQQIATAELAQKQQQIYRYLPDYLQAKQQASEPFGSAQYGYYKYNPDTKTYEQVSGPAAQFESNPITGELFNNKTGQPVGATGSGSVSDAFGAPAPAQTTLAQTNNNPGNIRNPATGQFAVYTTPQAGWQALESDIQAKISGNNAHGLGPNSTLQDFFNVYAPTGDGSNNPASYAQSVAQQLGVSPTTKLGDLSNRVQDFAVAIATHEGYFNGSTATGTPSGNIIDQSAQQLVDGTAAPSQFSKRGAQYQLILDKANQLSLAQTGHAFDAQQAEVNFSNKEAARPIINLEQSVESHLDTVLQDSAALNRSNSPAINQAQFAVQQKTGPGTALTKYLQAIQDAKGEISKLLAGSGAPTDETRNEANAMLNEFLGHGDLTAQIDQIKTLAKQKIAAYTNNNNGSQQSLSVSSSPVNLSDINFAF
jgi:hypothetical protein